MDEDRYSNLIYYQIQQMKIKDLINFCKKENAKIASLEEIVTLRVLENQTLNFRINKKILSRKILNNLESLLLIGLYLRIMLLVIIS